MKRLLGLPCLLGLMVTLTPGFAADSKEKAEERKALQALNEFVGTYKNAAGPTWTENIVWGWKFKGDDRWLHVDIEKGKHYKSGDIRYLADKKKYQLTIKTVDDKSLVFEGALKNDLLTLEHTDPESKQVTLRLVMNTVDEGARFVYRLDRKKGTIFARDFQVAGPKEGESFAAGQKKNLCCVTGGLGTMAVTYKGKTYYVCCSGCRDAFNDDPEKIIKEFEEAKKKK